MKHKGTLGNAMAYKEATEKPTRRQSETLENNRKHYEIICNNWKYRNTLGYI